MDTQATRSRRLLQGLAVAAFGAGLLYLLIGEHRLHVMGWIPFLLLLACPLLHLTMHGGHGGHGLREDRSRPTGRSEPRPGDFT